MSCSSTCPHLEVVKDFVVGENDEGDEFEDGRLHRAFDRGRDKQTERLVEEIQVRTHRRLEVGI